MTRAVTLAEIADTNTFIVDGTNNRVGIASTIPTVTLDVDGVVKATSFTGSITGSASGLTGTPDIAVGNITGVAATFTGVLTYEDVTNIDSIGIITARSDVSIADQIVHTGDTNTRIRFPAADTFAVMTAGSERLRVDSSGRLLVGTLAAGSNGTADDLVVANNGSASDQAGITIRGGTSGRSQIFFSDGTSGDAEYRGMLRYDHSDESMQFRTSAVEKLRITSAGLVRIPDNGKFTAGAGDDLQIFHDGTDSFVTNNTGQLILRVASVESALVAVPNGAVDLYYDNSKKLETSATGVTVTGTLNATTDVQINGKGAATTGKAIAMAMVFG